MSTYAEARQKYRLVEYLDRTRLTRSRAAALRASVEATAGRRRRNARPRWSHR